MWQCAWADVQITHPPETMVPLYRSLIDPVLGQVVNATAQRAIFEGCQWISSASVVPTAEIAQSGIPLELD